ncbi:MAG: LemA family protein [Bacilli bacterium]|nr:LemA family protein [Bacilli bacterium]
MVLIFIIFIVISNKIKKLEVKVKEASSSIEIALIKRYDILQSSYDIVKGYVKHEDNIMTDLIRVRQGMNISELNNTAIQQDKAISNIFAVAEQYPNLKANEVFSNLQRQLTEENTHYAAAKRVYNSNVSIYNQYIVTFPNSIIAGMTGAREKDFLKEDNVESKREIKFDF